MRALAKNKTLKSYSKGDYVAAVWGREWWIAFVTDVLVQDEYNLKFMHSVSYIDSSLSQLTNDECYVNWPEWDDICAIKQTDILCKVARPTKTTNEGVDCYTLPKKDVEVVEFRYQNFKF